jgi:hypothetical protein
MQELEPNVCCSATALTLAQENGASDAVCACVVIVMPWRARKNRARRMFLRIFAQHLCCLAFLFPFVFVKLLVSPPLMNFLRRSLDYALLGGFKRQVAPRAMENSDAD